MSVTADVKTGTTVESWTWKREKLSISESLAATLVTLAADSDEEVCGFIIDDDRVQPIQNTAKNPAHSWRMDHESMMACVNEYGNRIRAIFHSHPNNRDWPSVQDEAGISFLYKQGCPWAYLIVTSHGVSQFAYCKEDDDVARPSLGVPSGSDK